MLVRLAAQVQALLWRLIAEVPVELTDRQLRDAIAVVGERHEHGGQAAESALGWLGWEGDGPMLLRPYDVQRFAWYTLPRKFLTDLDDKLEAAELVSLTLDQLGDTARGYAEICRSEATRDVLRAWEAEDPTAWQQIRALVAASGIEPPDTDMLVWGSAIRRSPTRSGSRLRVAAQGGRDRHVAARDFRGRLR